MAVMPLVLWPDARLCQPAAKIEGTTAAIHDLAGSMLETMYAAEGRGLAAPQVGVSLRLFVMDATWKTGPRTPQVFINPTILWRSSVVATGQEGCLSLPGITTLVPRAQAIRLAWQDLACQTHEARLAGFAAICAQHEADHLDGVLTLDHLTPVDRATAERALS